MLTDVSVRTVVAPEEFLRLADIWNALFDRCEDRNPFLSWEWHYGWWTHLGNRSRPNVLVFERNGAPLGIAPLMRARSRYGVFELETLDFMGNGSADYGGLLLTEDVSACVEAFLRYLAQEARNGVVCRIDQMPAHSRCLREILRLAPAHAHDLAMELRPGAVCPYVSLEDDWDQYVSRFSPKRREDMRRKQRRLAAAHRLRVSVRDEDEDAASTSSVLNDLYQRKWGRRSPAEEAFFSELLQAWAKRGWSRYSSITLDGEIASAVLTIAVGDRRYYYRPAVQPAYARYSLGHLHLLELIRSAYAESAREYDLLRGEQDYKFAWATGVRETCNVAFHSPALWRVIQWNAIRRADRIRRALRRGLRSNLERWRKWKNSGSGPGAKARERWQRLKS